MSTKKRNLCGVLLYLLGMGLFLVSNLSVTSGSVIDLLYWQQVVLCSCAVGCLAAAPFVYVAKKTVGCILKFAISVLLIGCIFVFDGFTPNFIA